jgi:amidohydrolase
MGAKGQVTINELLPATVNHPTVSARMREVVSKLVGWDKITTDQQSTPSDDMAYFSQEAPGCYLVLGAARCENDYPHHNPKFDWDESVMPLGVAAMCMGAIELLPCKKA